MIFNTNHTSLGDTVAMAEGYDCAYGVPLALIEGAQNDLAMFKAMINADFKEVDMRRNNYVTEAELSAYTEAVGGGIWKKIAEIFRKLAEKIKAIFHTFMAKINGLYMKDKDLVKKYQKEVRGKKNLGNLEVKWRPIEKNALSYDFSTSGLASVDNLHSSYYSDDNDTMYNNICGGSWDSYEENKMKEFFKEEDATSTKISEITGGITGIMNYLTSYATDMNKVNSAVTKYTNALNKLAKDADKKVGTAWNKEEKDDTVNEANQKKANETNEVAKVYQEVHLKEVSIVMNAIKIQYQQNRAAFTKAVTANDKKLEESYLDAVAEAAEEEVDAVISDALGKEELSDLTTASLNVKDGDVCDCPEKNVYDKVQKYSDDAPMDDADGEIDVTINSREEAAMFGELLW